MSKIHNILKNAAYQQDKRNYLTKEKVELLSDRIAISPAIFHSYQSNSLTLIQNTLVTLPFFEPI